MRTFRLVSIGLGVAILTALAACGGGNGVPDDPTDPPGGGDAFLFEDFLDTANQDAVASSADWGFAESSVLTNVPTTSRHAHAYSYPATDSGVNSGLGQYFESTDPLTGTDLTVVPPYPAVALGRRSQWAFSDTQLGPAGTITAVSWGPVENRTVAATYPNVRLRMGFQAPGSLSLGAELSANYDGSPTVVYDGPYVVQAVANVGNPVGHPTTAHVGSYPEGSGCFGAVGAPGGHNAGLFAYTGWYPWPALSTGFEWDPGDVSIANDRRLLFDASVQAGDVTQRLRGWFAMTYPCSGILIGGYPEPRVSATYEGTTANPQDNFGAGILNPEPSLADMSFTITLLHSLGQSLFFEGAFGDDTEYGVPVLVPAAQAGAAVVSLQFQGADAVEADRRTVVTSQPFTDWETSVSACNGMRYLRFRFQLTPDPTTMAAARVDSLRVPMTDATP